MTLSDKVFLNLGCGAPGTGHVPPMFAAWRQVRVDIDPAVKPDVLADLTDLSPIGTGFADGLWAAHCIEHLYAHDAARALGEIHRVLRDDGFACIVVPDLQTIAGVIAQDRMHETLYQSPAGPITPHDIVYGLGPALARGHLTMAHRSGFTPTAMMSALAKAGFGGIALLRRANFELAAIVRKTDWPDLAARDSLLAALGL